MALVHVQRSPSPSLSSPEDVSSACAKSISPNILFHGNYSWTGKVVVKSLSSKNMVNNLL